jgi:two-component system sensor histidine kinase ChiS
MGLSSKIQVRPVKSEFVRMMRHTSNLILRGILAFSLIAISSCSADHTQTWPASMDPTVVEAKGFVLQKNSLPGPVVVPAGTPSRVKIGVKKEAPGTSNILTAGIPVNLNMSAPDIFTPGENGIALPKIVKAIENPFLCKSPEVVLVTKAYSRDINPANFSSYSKLQGLRADQVRSMIQDRLGNIWLGTDDGATRYDGKYFSRFSTDQGLRNNLILSVFQDSNDNMWFGTYGGGVTKYDGRFLVNFTSAEGLLNNIINCIFEDKNGKIWIGTDGGISVYDGEYFTGYSEKEGLCNNDVRSITQDNTGKMWIATSGGGISVFDGKSFSNYSSKQGFIQNTINIVYKDSKGNIWIGSSSRGFLKYDGAVFSWYSKNQGLSNDAINTVIEDDDGSIWFGTMEAGLVRFDGRYFTGYSNNQGLSSNFIRCALKDNNGDLWFGTRGGGITRYDGQIFTHLTSNEGLSNSRVMSILEDSGDLWLGTFGGYITRASFRETNGKDQIFYTYFDQKDGIGNNRIYSIIKDKSGNIWIGTDGGGVSKYDGEYMSTYTTKNGLGWNSIRKIIQDREGRIWFATFGGGVSEFDGEKFTNYTEDQGLIGNNVLTILQDSSHRIWIGTDKGVSCIDGDKIINYSKENGFLSNTVYSIFQDRFGIIWFGTGGDGIVRYDGKSFTGYTDTNELSNNYILSIFEDSKGNIWLGTRFGTVVINAETFDPDLKESRGRVFKSYGYEDGFIGLGCNMGAIAETEDGIIWIGTNDRLTSYHPSGNKANIAPAEIQLTGLQIFNEDIPWTDLSGKRDSTIMLHNGVKVGKFRFDGFNKWYGIPENLSLRYNNNFLTFKYIGVSITSNKKLLYQYMLEGVDENWNALTTRTEATYGNLSQGNYIFRVKAINDDGTESKEVSYPFSIRAPWWDTVWFYLLLLLTAGLLIYSIFRYRLRILNSDKQILEAKVYEQTHEITRKNEELQKTNAEKDKFFSIIAHDLRSPFSGFLGLTQQMADNLPDLSISEIKEIVISLKTSASNTYSLLENLLQWSKIQQGQIPFHPEKLRLSFVAKDSIIILEEPAKTKKIDIFIDISEDIFVLADINMLESLFRNLVSNAVKFTPREGKIFISAKRKTEGTIEVSVKDTGIGMNSTYLSGIFHINDKINRKGTEGEPSTGLGLLLCKEFAEKQSGKIWAESEEGKGTLFCFTLPSTY